MRRAWIAGTILAFLFAVSLWSGLRLSRFTEDITSDLRQAQSLAERGSWADAAQITASALRRFQGRSFFLHATLRHSDIDAVKTGFREVEQLLTHRERLGEYTAANARLIVHLDTLSQSEWLSLENIL